MAGLRSYESSCHRGLDIAVAGLRVVVLRVRVNGLYTN